MEWEEFINCLQLVMCVGNINSEQHIPILQVRQYSLMVIQINPIPLFMEVEPQCHTANNSRYWQIQKSIKTLLWSSQSLDMTLIEHLNHSNWKIIKMSRKLYTK